MTHCPRCGNPIPRAPAACPRCTPHERRAVATTKRVPARRFTALMRFLEVTVGSVALVGVSYLVGTGTGLVPPLDVEALTGASVSAATEFFIDPMAAAPPPPFEMELADAEVITLRSGDHHDESFEVRDPRPCTLTGHVVGLAGGKRDVEVYVLDDDAYRDWENGIRPRTVFESGRTSSTTLDVALPNRGRYHLLLSNRFSFLTAKRIRIDEARLRCA